MSVNLREENFFLVEASELSFDDAFMRHEPRDNFERELKDDLCYVITSRMKDFYCSKEAPQLSDNGRITFKNADVSYFAPYQFWNQVSKKFFRENKSRIGSRYQHSAYLGSVIKQLVDYGMPIEEAWKKIHDMSELYQLSKENPRYKNVNFSFYGKSEKLLSDDRGIMKRISIILKTGVFKRGYYAFSDESDRTYNLYSYWFGDTHCIPWIVYDKS